MIVDYFDLFAQKYKNIVICKMLVFYLYNTKNKPKYMKVSFVVIGKTVDPSLIKLIDDYQQRIKHYISFDMLVIPELKNKTNLSFSEQKEKEADLILKQIKPTDEVILLDEKGKQYTSVEFAKFVEKKNLSVTKQLVFMIGGPYGFSDRVYERAQGKIALSLMTFSHQMVRLIFIEQFYRAMTILKGEPYHHE